jgi:hypothetical protein
MMKLHHTKYTENYQDYILTTLTEDTTENLLKQMKIKLIICFIGFIRIWLAS